MESLIWVGFSIYEVVSKGRLDYIEDKGIGVVSLNI
jgi:hypothetical protein